MKKSTKRFVISSEAMNGLGFRVKTSGIDLTDYNNNSLLLFMHQRPKGERTDEVLPLGYMGDLELKDGKITGVPYFDETDPFAMKIYNKVENGTIKMCSAGLKPKKYAEINGEKWLVESSLQEVSICDIGSNKESLAIALYNDDNELINLADFTLNINKQPDMKLIELSAESVLPLLKLKEDANAEEAQTAIMNLVTLAEQQKTALEEATTANKELQDKIDLSEKEGETAKIVALVDKAVEDRKITADQKPSIVKLAEADFDSTKSYLEGLTPAATVASQTGKEGKNDESLVNLSWNELEAKGKLVQLKEQDFETFAVKFKEAFGTDYVKK